MWAVYNDRDSSKVPEVIVCTEHAAWRWVISSGAPPYFYTVREIGIAIQASPVARPAQLGTATPREPAKVSDVAGAFRIPPPFPVE